MRKATIAPIGADLKTQDIRDVCDEAPVTVQNVITGDHGPGLLGLDLTVGTMTTVRDGTTTTVGAVTPNSMNIDVSLDPAGIIGAPDELKRNIELKSIIGVLDELKMIIGDPGELRIIIGDPDE